MKSLLNFPVMMFIKDVFGKIVPTTILALPVPYAIYSTMEQGVLRFVIVSLVCCITAVISSLIVGVSKEERQSILNTVLKKIKG